MPHISAILLRQRWSRYAGILIGSAAVSAMTLICLRPPSSVTGAAAALATLMGVPEPGDAPAAIRWQTQFPGMVTPSPLSITEIERTAGESRSSDRTLAEYYVALQQLETAEDDTEALTLIGKAAARPGLVIGPEAGKYPAPPHISASSLLLRVTNVLCERAAESAAHRDAQAAEKNLRLAQAIAAQILATEEPTLEALQAVRSLDAKIGRTEVEVWRRLGRETAAHAAATRRIALQNFSRSQITPELQKARLRREQAVAEQNAAHTETRAALLSRTARSAVAAAQTDPLDQALAADLLRRYAAERVRLQS